MSIGTIESVPLDFRSPFDELAELRAVLTTKEIAELTGLRRETISRARPDSRFQRRTERALGDLYLVFVKLRSAMGDDPGRLAAVLRRPQEQLAGRSIADLLRAGEVEVILETLSSDAQPESGGLTRAQRLDARVAAVLDADPELRESLDAIETALIRHFGPGAEVERGIVNVVHDDPEGADELFLRVRSDLSIDERIDRLSKFHEREGDLLAPVHRLPTIGIA